MYTTTPKTATPIKTTGCVKILVAASDCNSANQLPLATSPMQLWQQDAMDLAATPKAVNTILGNTNIKRTSANKAPKT